MILTVALLAAAGCGLIPRSHHHRVGAALVAVAAPVATPMPLPPGATPLPPPPQNRKFVNAASRILAYERKLGSLARQYGNSDEARNLGGVMETEMALAEERLKALAISREEKTDAGGGWGHGGLEQLSSLKGGDFDLRFYEVVKSSGPEGYGAFDRAFREVTDADLKEFAKNWYPVLRDYPREAIKLEAQLKKKRK
jgi:predicted outer membrane protein